MTWLFRIARRFGVARPICVALLAALVFLRIADPYPLEELRNRTFDLFQSIRPRAPSEKPVAIIDIDDQSLRAVGQWPWPRTRLADLVTRLSELGAAVIAFDVIFPEPDRMSPNLAAETFRGLDAATQDKLRTLPSNDEVLANALRQSRVVLGESALPIAVPTDVPSPPIGIATLGGDPKPFLLTYAGILRNFPTLEQAAAGRGLITIRNERDGIVRRVPLIMDVQGAIRPSLAFEMLRVATDASTILIRSSPAGIESVAIPGFKVPTDSNGLLWIHFAPHDPSLYISAIDVLNGKLAPGTFKDKLVLIGTSAVGLLDVKTTPTDAAEPGVEVQAQILESMLSGAVLSSPDYAIGLELVAAVVIGLGIIALAPILTPPVLAAFGVLIVALLVASSWYIFTQEQLLIDFTFPLLSSALIYLTLMFANYVSEQSQRRRIRLAFGQYLSPTLVEQLAQSPEKLVLGGERRNMTIMFSDVRGFTTISEIYKDDPQGLTSLMNRFLTPLTNAIIDRKGTIDKYMGDAIMAFWNAPLDDAAHEINACAAALDMLDRIAVLNRQRDAEARESGTSFLPIHVGVGINTGPCVVGNMGSDLRFDYSVLGDSVNLASRLEGQCKSYGVPIIIGARTALAAKNKFAMIEIDSIIVKGKTEPEVIYAVLGREDLETSEQFQRLRELNTRALAHYRGRDWTAALSAIAEGRTVDMDGRLATWFDLYSERVTAFQASAPPDDWNGVYVLHTK
jgi:adenylate cyclase